MRVIYFLCGVLLCFESFSQHSTLRFTDEPVMLNKTSVLIVPFEDRMFLTDINKALAEHNSLNSREIVQRFSSAIDESIYYTFYENCDVKSFYHEDSTAMQSLDYIYNNLILEYELVSETKNKSGVEKIKDKLTSKDAKAYQRGAIKKGQVVTKRDDRKRYMKAVIKNNEMLDSIHSKFDNDFFLFVNQLDIKNDYSDIIAVQQGNYDRIIQLHYTLYKKDGSILSTGISATSFPNHLNDIDEIISGYFPTLAKNIFVDLFETEENEKNNTDLRLWK